MFLEGKTSLSIAEYLTDNNSSTSAGKNKWHQSTVLSFLQNEKYKALVAKYECIKEEIERIDEKRLEESAKKEKILEFINKLNQREGLITEFDEELWIGTVDKVVVNVDGKIKFVIKDGKEIKW